MTKNAYIHIPFCSGGKCNYCSFVSYARLDLKDAYLNALKKQICAEYKKEKLNTLYLGGGTPSLLSLDEVKSLLDLFTFENDAEITMEINPNDANLDYFKPLKTIGINRLSIGSQTFNDSILQIIGRRHNSAQIISALNNAKASGFNNISLDLIYGLPNQGIEEFESDLKQIIELNPQHVSLYGLKIEEGCAFYKRPPNNLPDNDMQADMYLKAVELLTNAGFVHYEVSNFALFTPPAHIYPSRHNLNYWDANSYYGFGCSASGYLSGIRYTNESSLEKYIESPLEKAEEQILTDLDKLEEAIFLGLRKIDGIDINEINSKFGINFEKKYVQVLNKYSKYFIKSQNNYALNLGGILISNEILSEFIEV